MKLYTSKEGFELYKIGERFWIWESSSPEDGDYIVDVNINELEYDDVGLYIVNPNVEATFTPYLHTEKSVDETITLYKLYNTVTKFMKNNGITCEETIYQTDRVIENAYEFIGELFNIIKADLDIEEEDE